MTKNTEALRREFEARKAVKAQSWYSKMVDWNHSTRRPGANDHLKYGSLQADGSIKAHRAPVHGCVGVLNDAKPHTRES